MWRAESSLRRAVGSVVGLVEGRKMRGEKPTRSLLAIACDWEITCLIRRIGCLECANRIRRLVLFCRPLEMQFWAMLAQPVAEASVVRAFLRDERPETWRMVAFFQVRQFMDDDVVQYVKWGQ